jgi:DNA invertase Pin-like site-specific DNA recombinase
MRLMAALKPRASFDVLIVSEESRIGREQIEVSFAVRQLVQAGVRIFSYLTDTERRLDSPIEKIMLSMQAMTDEMERAKASQRTKDALVQKFRAGHVTGGRVFGYDLVDVVHGDQLLRAQGAPRHPDASHVERRINNVEAAVVRRIFELSAAGVGQKRIAWRLNAEGLPSPLAQQGRPRSWRT